MSVGSRAGAAAEKPQVAVLLATLNGEHFLKTQLDSLAAQQGVAVRLFARDDGSTDSTLAILRAHADCWPDLARVQSGPRLGAAASFLTLLAQAPAGFDAYAFCDQDDCWLPDKLARACARLAESPASEPALYCSNVLCADRNLRPLGPAPVNDDTRFAHLLFENVAFGNTVVMNQAARARLASRPLPREAIMHDWWCALVTAAFGRVIHDPFPSVLYRQHGGNHIGASPSRARQALGLVRAFLADPGAFHPVRAQARELLELYGPDLPARERRLAAALVASGANLRSRLRYALSGDIQRRRIVDGLAVRALVAAGWY
ncbi:MAG TPA: glycosyltransferase family 2 protein [Caulobacteraceae bacterium]|nr:glycosyltransferase family 2 protein [Caulobacteraceae bacterium]